MSIRSAFSSLFNATWSSIGGMFGFGGYSATDPRRKILPQGNRPRNATANQLLTSSLPQLRAYCRHLERNNPTARASVEGLVASVVGTGIGLEPDTGDESINARLRPVWQDFQRDCTVNGQHDIFYLQCQAFREVVTAGEFLWRLVVLPERVDAGGIPLAVMPLEPEWLDDHTNSLGHPDANGIVWVGGVGVDVYGRALYYRIRNPEMMGSLPEIVAAKDILHDFEHRRALQARGEPWMAPIIELLQQERDLVDAELKAAVNTASIALVITSDVHDNLDTTEQGSATDPAQSLRMGGVARMFPGETVSAFNNPRPSQQVAPFRQTLRGDIAGAMRISQRYLDRDYGRANYSSQRGDNQDSNVLLGPVREWFGQATIGRLYQAALPYLALKAGIKLPRPNYRLLPDAQPYVNPVDDIKSIGMALALGLTTWEIEIAKRGLDSKKMVTQFKTELKDPLLMQIFQAHLTPNAQQDKGGQNNNEPAAASEPNTTNNNIKMIMPEQREQPPLNFNIVNNIPEHKSEPQKLTVKRDADGKFASFEVNGNGVDSQVV